MADPAGLRALPARAIVAALADAADRWRDADFPPRVRATARIRERTGYTEPVVDAALDRLFGALTRAALTNAICGELGSVDALDGFVARPGRADGYAAPVGRVAIVASDTTIGVALVPAAFALCAKCDVAVRDRGDALCAAFAETLAEERRECGAALATHVAAAHDDAAWLAELRAADAVVAFGGDPALRALRAAAAPQARFIAYGHRTSAGYVAREALATQDGARAVARGAAVDALLYDGDGCLSLHAIFVERGGEIGVARFAQMLSHALDEAAVEFPAAFALPPPRAASYRAGAAFRAAVGDGALFASTGRPHVAVLDPPRDEPPPLLPRTVALYGVDGPAEMLAFVRAHALPLEAVAVAVDRADVERAAIESGAVKLAPFGSLQTPRLEDEHGGIGRIAPFVKWIVRS